MPAQQRRSQCDGELVTVDTQVDHRPMRRQPPSPVAALSVPRRQAVRRHHLAQRPHSQPGPVAAATARDRACSARGYAEMAVAIRLPGQLNRLRRRITHVVGVSATMAAFLGLALIGGLATSYLMIEHGSVLNATQHGPWTQWTGAGQPGTDPYSRARFVKQGSLVMSTAVIERYEARSDSEGRRLHSACDYVLEGRIVDRRWWQLAVFDEQGWLIRNAADRYGFDSTTLARGHGGHYAITLSRDARPGNWLPIASAGRFVIVVERQPSPQGNEPGSLDDAMPAIRRIACP